MSNEPNIAVIIALVAHGLFCEAAPLPWEASLETDFGGPGLHAWCLRDANGQPITWTSSEIDLPSIVSWINERGTLTVQANGCMSFFVDKAVTMTRTRTPTAVVLESVLDELEDPSWPEESPVDAIRRLKFKCDRHEQLRRQAEQLCERRTIERDEARAALAHQAEDAELGRALRDLVTQLRRLRRYKIPGFVWSPTGVIRSLCDEIWELASETPSSNEAKAEVLDVLCVALQIMDTYNVEMIDGFTRAAMKLDRRLTHIDEGGTWESAKALEGEEA